MVIVGITDTYNRHCACAATHFRSVNDRTRIKRFSSTFTWLTS